MQSEHRRLVLLLCLALILGMIWHTWQQEHPVAATDTVQTTAQDENNPVSSPSSSPASAAYSASKDHSLISVKTDTLALSIDPVGGSIVQAQLLNYPEALHSPLPVTLFNTKADTLYVAQSNMISENDQSTAKLEFTSAKNEYQLLPGDKSLVVTLNAKSQSGQNYSKSFTFYPEQYKVDVTYEVKNNSSQNWKGFLSNQLSRADNGGEKAGMFNISAYFGASYSTQNQAYEKVSFKKMLKEPVNQNSLGGWIAMQQHYFLSAWIPDAAASNHYYSLIDNSPYTPDHNIYTIGVDGPSTMLAPGDSHTFNSTLYVGPEIAGPLKALAPHLDLTIDYGFLWFISVIIFWLMEKIYFVVGNWGWSIILVTIVIKAIFYHLSATSYRSMAKMRDLQPKIKSLQERYGDDRAKLSQATMELYKKEKANPLSGCLPMLIQIPVFIALYWVLVESVQLRQAPFILWIHDLSIKDPYYVLPILNGLAMFFQQKLNPPPPDPTQAKLMMLMPVFLTVVFLNFPAGLVLYWLVNSLFSIAQQWWIMSRVQQHTAKRKRKSHKK